MKYAISTFCYGDRYYKQTNRLIESFDQLEVEKPEIFIVTDNPDVLIKKDFVKVANVSEFSPKYLNYKKDNYYEFDFSVKRFSLLYAFQAGYENVILTDTDAIPNYQLFNTESVMNTFVEDAIGGQVTYNFQQEQQTNSMLGDRFKFYEKFFGVEYDKNLLNEMVEDCIQFISIKGHKRFQFIHIWDECIKIKDSNELRNAPAGNIDEMCFSALYNGLKIVNTSSKSVNLLVAHHDKWY
jgi:hypothetical protein